MAEQKAAAKKTANAKTPASKKAELFKARVVGGSLNVRKAPGLEAPVLKVLPDGETVGVTAEKHDWYRTEEGWIMAKYTEKITEA